MDIEAAKEKHKEFLKSLANVVGIGIGPKVCGGRVGGGMAIKVFVCRKVPEAELTEADRIPPVIEGFPTDVEVLDSMKTW